MSRPSRERPEQVIQRAVFDHLRARGPGVFATRPTAAIASRSRRRS